MRNGAKRQVRVTEHTKSAGGGSPIPAAKPRHDRHGAPMPSIISKTWEAIIGFASTELLARALPGGRWPLHWLSRLRSIAQSLRGQRPRSVSRPKHPISYSMSLVRQRKRSSCRRDDKWLSS